MGLIKEGIKIIFQGFKEELGIDTNDPNFSETPERVERAYYEILSGGKDTNKQIEEILAKSFPSDGYEGPIVSTDIIAYSLCPHHLLPVVYTVYVAYMPSKEGNIIGLSKINRVVEVLAKRLVLQEKFTKDIVDFMNKIKPHGVAVYVEGIHFCMRMRGVKSQRAVVTTSHMSGCFLSDFSIKAEFHEMINRRRSILL